MAVPKLSAGFEALVELLGAPSGHLQIAENGSFKIGWKILEGVRGGREFEDVNIEMPQQMKL